MLSKEAAELKQQGAIEAARNPHSQVTAHDAEKEIVEQSKKAGIAAFHFDPHATPQQKQAQARAAIPPGLQRKSKAVGVVSDVDDGTGPDEELPEPTKAGVIEAPKDANGAVVAGKDPKEKEAPYLRTGWAPRLGWPEDDEEESLLDHTTWVETKLPDHLYGDWYHNAGIIIFACISSWLVAVLGGGLAWLMIVMAICSTYYRTSLRRVRRNFRDDIQREMALTRLETDNESLEWINSFMVKFWPIYQPVLAQTVINSVDQVLSSATPGFLDSLKLKTFTLGSKPPRMDHVKTYPKTEDDTIIMDWKFSFTPNDTDDMTARQLKNKINPKVVLEIRIGKAMISKGLDVIVEDMAFSGIMQLKIKLQIPFPHIERIEMCFLEKPTIDYVCKPLGGDALGFDINFIPGLESFILDQIHGNLAPMMYAPKVFPIEIAKMLAGNPIDQAVGVLAVTLHGANGLKNTDSFSGSVDPYASITLNRRQELARTKTIEGNANPRWNETHYIIITSFSDSLDLQIFDKNDFRKHKELGVASFPLEKLEEAIVHENLRLEVIHDGKPRGTLSCDLNFFPVLEGVKTEDGKESPPPESNQGILKFTVQQAKDLDGSKSLVGQLNPYAQLFLNGKQVHETKKLKRTNNPIWDDGSKELLITDRTKAKLGLTVKDDRDLAADQVLGKYQIKLDDLLECMEKGQEWFHLADTSTGRVNIKAQWRPVAISGVVGTGGYATPIGVMRFHFFRGSDLRNFEAFGKSDPYARILCSGIEKAKTVTFRNNLDPEWDEVLYVPIHSPREKLTLEVMDQEKVGQDRSLGQTEVIVSEYVKENTPGDHAVHDTKQIRNDGLRLKGQGVAKGTLTYTAAFYPCLNIADPEDDAGEKMPNGEKAVDASSSPTSSNRSSIAADAKTGLKENHNGESRPRTAQGPPKLRLSPEELLKYESGLLIFHLMEAEMPEADSHLEIFVDDYMFPSYVSSSVRQKAHKFDEIGDCVIRELDFSKLTIRARNKKDDDDEDHTLAYVTGNTLDTLRQCLNNPTTLKLKTDEGKPGSVKVSLKYIPLKMQLHPSESITNMGKLQVTVLDAQDLPAADRNGKSDPFCRFELNGQEIWKTKTIKKTLNPTWNEQFDVAIPSRTAAKFIVNVYDYDLVDKPDFLGAATINLESIHPFQANEVRYPLDGKSGSIRLRFVFRPDYISRSKQGTSTFAGTFAAPTRILTGVTGKITSGATPIAAGVSGVGKGAGLMKRGLFGRKESTVEEDDESDREIPVIKTNGADSPDSLRRAAGPSASGTESPADRPTTSNGPHHHRTKSFGSSSRRNSTSPAVMGGSATFTIIGATGYPPSSDLYVMITQISPREKMVGKTKHFKSSSGQWQFDDTFRFPCAPDAQFKIEVKGEHLFGADDHLGEHVYFVDESGAGGIKDLSVGSGTVAIKSSFQGAESSSLLTASPKAPHSRRSFLSKREVSRGSREVTPNP